jgi:ubiquinone/menaquinone biosynthesis C-methylase UbiE
MNTRVLSRTKSNALSSRRLRSHFSKIAHKFDDLRMTDLEPILSIKKKLQNLKKIDVADIGCGEGRYDIELFRYLGERLHLTCIDDNKNMLSNLTKTLKGCKIRSFRTVKAPATTLPLVGESLDAVVTFNAIHHFDLPGFLKEASRVLRPNGCLFIYTRLRSQNKRNIWGRYFPKFHEKEKRLYELNELKELSSKIPSIRLNYVEYFKYRRMTTLARLIKQATGRHYSTFCFYDKKEFRDALLKFQKNIAHHFANPDRITWYDENVMLVIRKTT